MLARIKNQDVGIYISSEDVGIHAKMKTGGSTTSAIGKLRWGLAQFGTVGILGIPPVVSAAHQTINIRQV